MLGFIHFVFILLGLFFGFHWGLITWDEPFDAMYRAYVLEFLRLLVTVIPFAVVTFRWRRQGFRRQAWTIGLLVLALYLVYYSVFGSTGFVASMREVIADDFQRLLDPAKYLMFVVWGYFVLFALWVNRERLPLDVEGWDD